MQNIPIAELVASAALLLAYVRFGPALRSLCAKLKTAPASASNGMTWETKDGAIYDEVSLFFVRGNGVTFRHKYGTVRLAIADLTDSSRAELIRQHHENFALAILPIEDEQREERAFEAKAA